MEKEKDTSLIRKTWMEKNTLEENTSLIRMGSVDVRLESDSVSEHVELLIDRTWTPSITQLPTVVPPSGLPLERQWYLYSHIREYCSDEVKDEVCPRPVTPLSSGTLMTAASTTTATSSTAGNTAAASTGACNTAQPTNEQDNTSLLPPAKRTRTCSKCHMVGHNARTCGK